MLKVWVKILHGEDSDLFNREVWIEMRGIPRRRLLIRPIPDRNDFLEFTYNFPAAYMIGYIPNSNATGAVQYTSSAGIKFVGFKYFALKVGLLGSNSAIIPRVADLRASPFRCKDMRLQKTDIPGIMKDGEGVLLNVDNKALYGYKQGKLREGKINTIEQELTELRNDMQEIKQLLKGLVK